MMTSHRIGHQFSQFIWPTLAPQQLRQCNLAHECVIYLGIRTPSWLQASHVYPFTLETRAGLPQIMAGDHE